MGPGEPGTYVVVALGVVAGLVVIAGLVWIIRNVLRTDDLSNTAKTIWIIVLIAAPILGIIAWLVFQARTSSRIVSRV